MEEDIRKYLLLIVNTISKALIWMMVAVVWGLKYKWAFIQNDIAIWKNSIFYLALIISFIFLLRHILAGWYPKKKV
jgi:hypothetical protein